MAQTLSLLYQRYRLIALAIYGAVLSAGLIDWIYGGIGPRAIVEAPENYRFLLFAIAVLTLIVLELRTVGSSSFGIADKGSLMPFLARLFLFLCVCLVTDLSYSKLLFLPLLLYSYLAVNHRLSYVIAVLGVAALLGLRLSGLGGMRIPPPPPVTQQPANIGAASSKERPPLNGRLMDQGMGSLIMLFFTLLLARTLSQAIQAQQKLTALLSSLEASHVELKHYSTRVADLAATEERNRLARDIHDSLGHHLAAINIQLEKANAYRDRNPSRAYEAVNHAQRTVQDALKDVRESVSSLRQDSEPFLFEDALNSLIRRMDYGELELRLHQSGESSSYSRLKLMTLYRVIQEGLTNVHKHAEASQVRIALTFEPQQAILELSDNGCGFDIDDWKTTKNELTAQGLIGLQERLSLVGGNLTIRSRPQGTTLMVSIPWANSQSSLGAAL
ncbi:MAG: sensor histidine kinase [Cyanobacteria bacterium P01_A01_bin.137]